MSELARSPSGTVKDRHDLAATLPWLRSGTDHVIAVVARLTDDELRAPSALPGWSRAHVVGHLARNAEALTRLAAWAATGVATPMYADGDQRSREIEESALRPVHTLRAELTDTAEKLDSALAGLTPQGWRAEVRSALGRAIPAAELPWMRVREVWLHAVDLQDGAGLDALPACVVDLLLDEVTVALGAKPGCPDVQLRPVDRALSWSLGAGPPASTVTGSAAELAGWLTGRTHHAGAPALPRWL